MLFIGFLCALGDVQITNEITATLECGGIPFTAKGRTIQQKGWKELDALYKNKLNEKTNQEAATTLPSLEKGQTFQNISASIEEGTTSPPTHFTEDTLLASMENADAKEFSEIEGLERKGLGTPATRASIIEKLIKGGFVERKATKGKAKYLLPSKMGTEIIQALPDSIKSAKLTAQWEAKLKQVERGELEGAIFLKEISTFISDLTEEYKGHGSMQESLGQCPFCGKKVIETEKSYCCESCHDENYCGFALWKQNYFFQIFRKTLTKEMAVELLQSGRVFVKGLFSEKKQKYFDAYIILAFQTRNDGKKQYVFQLDFSKPV